MTAEAPPASNPCQEAMQGPTPFTGDASEPTDIARWRHAERNRLRAGRMRLTPEGRETVTRALERHLTAILQGTNLSGRVVGAYWPIRGEADLRPFLRALRERGAVLTLPVCETPVRPMRFRRWQPEQDMERGLLGIPVPPAASGELTPELMIVPLLGWDMDRFRLGFGAGYFDRTLATLDPRPYCIGIGLQSARMDTIRPQPHDIPMDVIVTEAGVQAGHPPRPLPLPPERV